MGWDGASLLLSFLSVTEGYFHGNLSEILRNLNGITNAFFPIDPF